MKCVYKLKCRDTTITEFYIGSSMDFHQRKRTHKYRSTSLNCKEYCSPLYMFINVNGGIDNWEFEIIKEYKFITEEELNINEQYYLDLLNPHLNSYNAIGVDIEKHKECKIQYYKTDKYINSRKIRVNCPQCGKEMIKNNMSRHLKVCKGV